METDTTDLIARARAGDHNAFRDLVQGHSHGALERADLDALIELLVTDVRISMPPAMAEYRGTEAAQRVFAANTFRPGRTYRVIPTRANGQPALGVYLADSHASAYRAYALLVITTAGDHITAITGFTPNVMTRFGLPRTLPETD